MFEELPLTWRNSSSAFLSFFWRSVLITTIVAFIVGTGFNLILTLGGFSEKVSMLPALKVLEVLTVFVLSGAFTFKWLLSKKFKGGKRWLFAPRGLTGNKLVTYIQQQRTISLEKSFKAWNSFSWRVSIHMSIYLIITYVLLSVIVKIVLGDVVEEKIRHLLMTSLIDDSIDVNNLLHVSVVWFKYMTIWISGVMAVRKVLNKDMGLDRLSLIVPVLDAKKIEFLGDDSSSLDDESFI
jgi:hypothetical protein